MPRIGTTRIVVPSPPEELHLRDYVRVLHRYRGTVAGVFLAAMLTGALWVYTTRPVYTATAVVQLEKSNPKVVKFDDVMQKATGPAYYITQVRILRSRAIAEEVIRELGLDRHPQFREDPMRPGWRTVARTWVGKQLDAATAIMPDWLRSALDRVGRRTADPREPGPQEMASTHEPPPTGSSVTQAFLDLLTVEAVEDSYLVNVSFRSYYPELSSWAANAVVEAFIRRDLDQQREGETFANRFLGSQLEDTRKKLETSEARLNDFLKANDILFLAPSQAGQVEGKDLLSEQVRLLSSRLLQAQADRISKESLVAQSVGRDTGSLPAVLESPVIGTLKAELAKAESEQSQLAPVFRPGYPRMEQLAVQIDELRGQLARETSRIVNGIENEYRAARLTEQQLQRQLDSHRLVARRLGDQMATYNLLRRDLDANREMYASLLTRLKETGVSAGLAVSSFAMVDRAVAPRRPSSPRTRLVFVLAGFVGLVGGVGAAFLRQYLHTSIQDTRELEQTLQVPALGLIPSRNAILDQAGGSRRSGNRRGDRTPLGLVSSLRVASPITEAFRQLRTILLCSPDGRATKTLAVTSLQPGDGKTSLATNLAIVLGQLEAGEVLMIDADMRRPSLHKLFGFPLDPGLSALLNGEARLEEVVRPTHIRGLSIIPAGEVPHNPADLLSSPRLTRALDELRRRFSHIVFDATPLFGVADAAVLASKVDGVILVLRHRRAHRDVARQAIRRLDSVGARVLGVVLNDVDLRAGDGDYAQYRYYYGSESDITRETGI